MCDGASYGVKPTRALETIIGGKPSPPPDELQSVIEMRDQILATPIETPETYDDCCYAVAHSFLKELLNNPISASLDLDALYIKVRDSYDEGSKERDLFAGLSGFQVGWAFNAARRCVELEPKPNPAIISIGTDDEA